MIPPRKLPIIVALFILLTLVVSVSLVRGAGNKSADVFCAATNVSSNGNKRLLVLLGGLGSNTQPENWDTSRAQGLSKNVKKWARLLSIRLEDNRPLSSAYGGVLYFSYSRENPWEWTGIDSSQSIFTKHVPLLRDTLASCRAAGWTSFDLVGHSMGGVTANEYIKHYGLSDTGGGWVKHVVTLDSPVNGSFGLWCHNYADKNLACDVGVSLLGRYISAVLDKEAPAFNGTEAARDLAALFLNYDITASQNKSIADALQQRGTLVRTITNSDDLLVRHLKWPFANRSESVIPYHGVAFPMNWVDKDEFGAPEYGHDRIVSMIDQFDAPARYIRDVLCKGSGESANPYCLTPNIATLNPPPVPTSVPISPSEPVDTAPPSASGFSTNVFGNTVNLTVSGAYDAGSGVRQVNYSAKWNNGWYGIGSKTSAPYALSWDMCLSGVPDGNVELGMEVIDGRGNKWVWSQHYPNPHVTKNFNCNQEPPRADGVYLYRNDGLDINRGGECHVTQDVVSIGNYCTAHCNGSTCGGGWNDEVESVRNQGPFYFVLYWDDRFQGGAATFGNYAGKVPDNFKNQASSIRVRKVDPAAVTLFRLGDYNGEQWKTDRTIFDMAHWGWNDRAQSIRIASGYGAIVCSGADFRGACGRATGPAQWPDINALANGLRDGVSSIRVCSGTCPDAGPVPTLVSPVNGEIVLSTQSVILQWQSEKGKDYYVELWGGALTGTQQFGYTGTGAWDLGKLPASSAPYYWRIKSNHGYGDTGWSEGLFTVREPDVTRPTGTTTAPSGTFSETMLAFAAEASDDQSGVASVDFYYYQDETWVYAGTDSSAPYLMTWFIPADMPDGEYYASIDVVDRAGNHSGILGDPYWRIFTLDRQAPEMWITDVQYDAATSSVTLYFAGVDNRALDNSLQALVQYQVNCAGEWSSVGTWQNLQPTTVLVEKGNRYCLQVVMRDDVLNRTDYGANVIEVEIPETVQPQEISFATIPDRQMSNSMTTLSVRSSSGLLVTVWTTTPEVCFVVPWIDDNYNDVLVGAWKPGVCSLVATQEGTWAYYPAASVSRSFTIRPADSTIPTPTPVQTVTPVGTSTATSTPFWDGDIHLPLIQDPVGNSLQNPDESVSKTPTPTITPANTLAPPSIPSARLSSTEQTGSCGVNVFIALEGFTPNSDITVVSQYQERECGTENEIASGWQVQYNQPTDSFGKLMVGFHHNGYGEYTYQFIDEQGKEASLSFALAR